VDSTIVRDPANTNTYYYQIAATSGGGTSAYTSPQCIAFAPRPVAPSAPQGFTLSALSTEEIQAAWMPDQTGQVIGYNLALTSYNPPKNYSYPIAAGEETYTVEGLQKNKTYCGTLASNLGTTPMTCATTHLK
jgi:hypothetical protein